MQRLEKWWWYETWLVLKHILGVLCSVLNAGDTAGNKSDMVPALTESLVRWEGGNWTSNRECQENLLEEVSRESEVRAQILSCSGNQWWVERETWDSLLFSMWQLWTANKRFSIPDPSQRPVSALSVLAQSKRNHVYAWEIFEVLVHRMLYLKIYQNKVYFFIKIAWLIDNSILYCKVKQIFH